MVRAVLLGTGMLFAAAGCSLTEEPYHEIRIRNNFDKTIQRLVVGPVSFYDVRPGETTEYLEIPEGRQNFHGTLTDARTIEGAWGFYGRGRHYWTAVLAASGTFTFTEDE